MKLGISSCLLGNFCRYDGAHAKDSFVVDVLQKYFDFVPFCPEKMVFGTPRETIRLVEENEKISVITHTTHKNVTEVLENSSQECVSQMQDEELCGFILKSKSPTCGLERVKVYEVNSHMNEKKGVGLFAQAIIKKYPYLPIEEEGRLNDPWLRENFLMQIFAYHDFYTLKKECKSINYLVEFHSKYKYLIFSKSQLLYKSMGQVVANHEKKSIEELLLEYEQSFISAIALKSDIKKTCNVLLHIFGYLKKLITKEEKEELLDAIDEFKDEVIPLIAVIKLLNIYINRFQITYLQEQKFLNPYPKELALRSNIRAYK